MGRQVVCGLLALLGVVASARGQAGPAGGEALRFDRTLEQIRQSTLLQTNQQIPLDQRVTFDYGGYVSYAYISFNDNNNDNTGLRQTDLYGYGRLNVDGAHEFFLRYH